LAQIMNVSEWSDCLMQTNALRHNRIFLNSFFKSIV
jgi:hypothetical protein